MSLFTLTPPAWQLQSILSFLLTLVFVSFVLRSKNPPGSTWAWLLFILVVPYVGIPAYLVFGGRKIGMMKRKASQTLPPVRSNTEVKMVSSGVEAYREVIAIIESAQRNISLATFIFSGDQVGLSVLEALTKKAQAGVHVRVLLDSLGSLWVRQPSFRAFKAAGGRLSYFMPLIHMPFRGRANLRNHRKILTADGSRAILGGMNIAEEYMGPTPDEKRWVDLALKIVGPSAADIENVFAKDWQFATKEDIRVAPSPPESTTDHKLQIITSGPDCPGDPLYDSLLTMIFKANTRIWVASPYFIPDESLARALQLASQRGVDVRLLIPLKSNHWLADLARSSYVRQLEAAKCKVSLFPRMIHAKAFLVDDSHALVGSANFDMRSLLYNYEIGAFMTSPSLIASLETWFAKSLQEENASLPAAGFWRDMAEGIGRVLGPLI